MREGRSLERLSRTGKTAGEGDSGAPSSFSRHTYRPGLAGTAPTLEECSEPTAHSLFEASVPLGPGRSLFWAILSSSDRMGRRPVLPGAWLSPRHDLLEMSDVGSTWPKPPRILLSGRPGCGKTTLVQRLVGQIGPHRCAGFYTEEVRERGRRIGFDVVTLDGRRGPLARVGRAGPRVGRYAVDVGSFERLALSSLEATDSGRPQRKVFVLDEIGKMELFSARFVALLRGILDDPLRPILGTVLAGRHPVVEPIRRRGDVRIVQVGTENRDRLPAEIGRLFVEYLEAVDGSAGS